MLVRCWVCHGDKTSARYSAREMMFGLREQFNYVECSNCGALQIESVPDDMSRYYPSNYCSFGARGLLRILKDERLRYVATGKSLLGWAIWRWKPMTSEFVDVPNVAKDAAILDIGCGAGQWLEELYFRGFRRLFGVDRFAPDSVCRLEPFRIMRRTVLDLATDGARFDFVYAGHSLEHIAEQRETVRAIAALLKPGGKFRFLVPWVSSEAWEKYRTDWVQLDAPRHFVLHSRRSLEILAESAGLRLTHLECNSGSMQFWGSEQYLRDIPLRSRRSLSRCKPPGIFTQAQIAAWEREAGELNARLRGDQIVAEMSHPASD